MHAVKTKENKVTVKHMPHIVSHKHISPQQEHNIQQEALLSHTGRAMLCVRL